MTTITQLKFTPGPWEAVKGQYKPADYEIYGQSEFDKPQIATVAAELWGSELPAKMNAQLIAAAPDLLEALTWMLSLFTDGQYREDFQDQTSVALEKAEAAISRVTQQ